MVELHKLIPINDLGAAYYSAAICRLTPNDVAVRRFWGMLNQNIDPVDGMHQWK